MELLLLGLIGFGAFSFFLDDDDPSTPAAPRRGSLPKDDDTPLPPPADMPLPPPAAGQMFELVSGLANPTGTTGNDTFSGNAEGDVLGGAGADLFDFDGGYAADIYGGAGNDTFGDAGDAFTLHGDAGDDLIAFSANDFEFAVAYGGAGNDRFEIDVIDSDFTVGPTLSGGSGADVFDLDVQPGFAERAGAGKVVTITDFTPGEDSLSIDFPDLARTELVEDPDGAHSDLNLHYLADDGQGGTFDRYLTIRLQGITGTTLDDLGITLPTDGILGPDTADLVLLRNAANISTGGGDDTIRAADGFENAAMDGLIIDAGAGNDEIDLRSLIGGQIVDGGAGDDRIIGRLGTSSVFSGGEGDDTIIGGGSHTLYGGGGNDVLEVGASALLNGVSADGGEGDDHIIAELELGRPSGYRSPFATGGDGADVFELRLNGVIDPATVADDDEVTYHGLHITDFDATRDRLVVDLTALEDPGPTVQALDVTTTGVAITFSNGARGFISCNTQGLQEGDIELRSRQTAA